MIGSCTEYIPSVPLYCSTAVTHLQGRVSTQHHGHSCPMVNAKESL